MNSDTPVTMGIDSFDIPAYIDKPEYVTNRLTGLTIQVFGWCCWMWFVMPVITLILWWLEGKNIYQQLFLSFNNSGRYSIYLLIGCIFFMITMLYLWATYNWIRFHHKQRRFSPQPATIDQIAKSFKVSVDDVSVMKKSRNLVLHYDDQGYLISYENFE